MKQNKSVRSEKEPDLSQNEHNRDNTSETDSSETITKDGALKPSKELFKNTHSKPADEQQFEDND